MGVPVLAGDRTAGGRASRPSRCTDSTEVLHPAMQLRRLHAPLGAQAVAAAVSPKPYRRDRGWRRLEQRCVWTRQRGARRSSRRRRSKGSRQVGPERRACTCAGSTIGRSGMPQSAPPVRSVAWPCLGASDSSAPRRCRWLTTRPTAAATDLPGWPGTGWPSRTPARAAPWRTYGRRCQCRCLGRSRRGRPSRRRGSRRLGGTGCRARKMPAYAVKFAQDVLCIEPRVAGRDGAPDGAEDLIPRKVGFGGHSEEAARLMGATNDMGMVHGEVALALIGLAVQRVARR